MATRRSSLLPSVASSITLIPLIACAATACSSSADAPAERPDQGDASPSIDSSTRDPVTRDAQTDSERPAPDASDAGSDSQVVMGHCPTVTLGSTLPIQYDGDTTGKENLVTSTRLEWTNAPEDALLFIAPETADYQFDMPTSVSANGGCGISLREASGTFYDESSCPAKGTVKAIDGYYVTPADVVRLTANQHVLLFIGCTYWSSGKFGPYRVTIAKR